jgi:hypothetical protein
MRVKLYLTVLDTSKQADLSLSASGVREHYVASAFLYYVAEFVKKHILRSLNTPYNKINFKSNWLLDTVAEWMKCILYMWRVLHSDINPHTKRHKLCDFSQSTRANLSQIRPRSQPSTSNPIHYSPTILPSNAVPELLATSLNKLTHDA